MSWKENHLDRSYRGINLFTFHQFTSKINDNSFFMGTSAILLTFAIMFSVFGFDAASSMKINAEKDRKIVSDIMFTYDDGSMEFEEVLEVIRKKTGIREWCQVKIYDFSKEDVAYYMLLSDYNNLMVMAGNEPLDLEGTEFLVHSNYESVSGRDVQYEVPKKIYIGENQMEGVLSPYIETVIDRRLSPMLYRDKNHLFIVADEYIVGELDAVGVLFVNTLKQPEYNLRNEISKMNSMRNSSKIDKINVFNQRVLYSMNIRSESVNGWLRREAEFLFMGLYMAIIILICIVTFLSIHIMSDFRSYKENVDILRNLGARQSEIDKSIKVQLAMYFIFPLFAAVITNIVIDAFFFFSYLGAGDIMRVKALIINMGMVAVFIGVVYLGYGVLCYRHMKRHLEV